MKIDIEVSPEELAEIGPIDLPHIVLNTLYLYLPVPRFTVTMNAGAALAAALRAEFATAQAINAQLAAAARAMRAAWSAAGEWPATPSEMRALQKADDGLRDALASTARHTPYKPLTEEEIEAIYANDHIDGWCGHDLDSDALQAIFKRVDDMRARTVAGAQ